MTKCDFPSCRYTKAQRRLAGAEKRSLHSVPAKQKKEVAKCLGIAFSNMKVITICSAHFVEGACVQTKGRAVRLKPGKNFLELLGKQPSTAFSAERSISSAIRLSLSRNHRISLPKGNLARTSGSVANSSSLSSSPPGSDYSDQASCSSAHAILGQKPIEISMRRAFQSAYSPSSSSTSQHGEAMEARSLRGEDGRRFVDCRNPFGLHESLSERLAPEYVNMANDLEDMAQSLRRKIARLKEMIHAESGAARKFLKKQRARLQQLKKENHALASEHKAFGEVCHDFVALGRMQDNLGNLLRRAHAVPSTSSKSSEDAM